MDSMDLQDFCNQTFLSILNRLIDQAQKLEQANRDYQNEFSKNLREGVFSSEIATKPWLACYYRHANLLDGIFNETDQSIAHLSRLLIQADQQVMIDLTTRCDLVIQQYTEFSRRLHQYIAKSQSYLVKSDNAPALSELLALLRELQYQTGGWIRFLREVCVAFR